MGTLSESTIEAWIVPHLTVGKRGFPPTVPLVAVVQAILHRLKTGCQWRELPTKQFFGDKGITWGGSLIRPEATGYGSVYFAQEMLMTRGQTLEGRGQAAGRGEADAAGGQAVESLVVAQREIIQQLES